MPELLSLPIPFNEGFEIVMETWIEPFDHIIWLENCKLPQNFDLSSWNKPIDNLMKIVEYGHINARIRAIMRLFKVYSIRALTQEEEKKFADALWKIIDEKTGLPDFQNFLHNDIIFDLPEPQEGISEKKYREYLISKDFFANIDVNKKNITYSISEDIYIDELLSNTKMVLYGENFEKKVNLTQENIVQLLNKVIKWWINQKQIFERNEMALKGIKDNTKESVAKIIQLISYIILPNLKNIDDSVKNDVRKLLSEINNYNIPIANAIPMTLFIDPNNYEEIIQKTNLNLLSNDEEIVRGAISGISNWLVYSKVYKIIPEPPDIFLSEIINKIVKREKMGLLAALKHIELILKKFPTIFTEKNIKDICLALNFLFEELKFPTKFELIWKENINIWGKSINYLPDYKTLVSELAYRLYIYLKNENKPIPDILNKWKDDSLNSPFPEIKRIWANYDAICDIDNLTEIIEDIASQTNTLAFNAAVEASKDGEKKNRFDSILEQIEKTTTETDIPETNIKVY